LLDQSLTRNEDWTGWGDAEFGGEQGYSHQTVPLEYANE
jgi:hypothetical protein